MWGEFVKCGLCVWFIMLMCEKHVMSVCVLVCGFASGMPKVMAMLDVLIVRYLKCVVDVFTVCVYVFDVCPVYVLCPLMYCLHDGCCVWMCYCMWCCVLLYKCV